MPRAMTPEALRAALSDRVGPVHGDWADVRAKVEAAMGARPERAQELDPYLLAVRELEVAAEGLPPDLAGLRRGRIIEQDPVSVTFEAFAQDGGRHALRALRPAWRRDPVWRRRLERAPAGLPPEVLGPGSFVDRDGWPCRVQPLPGPSLADLLPAEDRPDPRQLAAFLGGGLAGLSALHRSGRVHGSLGAEHLVQGAGGVSLLWLDPVLDGPREPRDDLAALGAAVSRLDPEGQDAVGSLARGLAGDPPPSAELAIGLLKRVLASVLTDRRHRLALRSRTQARRMDEARLLHAVHRLQLALPPPVGSWCLRAGHDAVMVVVESDGEVVRGGPVGGLPARFLPQAWSAREGLNPATSRALLRAWATKERGNEARRLIVQAELGAEDHDAAQLCRWLSAQARLRSVRLLLELGT